MRKKKELMMMMRMRRRRNLKSCLLMVVVRQLWVVLANEESKAVVVSYDQEPVWQGEKLAICGENPCGDQGWRVVKQKPVVREEEEKVKKIKAMTWRAGRCQVEEAEEEGVSAQAEAPKRVVAPKKEAVPKRVVAPSPESKFAAMPQDSAVLLVD